MKKTIGRDPNVDYVVFDPKRRVSRLHAEIEFLDNKYYISDLGSTNGTFVNGLKIQPKKKILLNGTDKVTLSIDYPLDFINIFKLSSQKDTDSESTKIFGSEPKKTVHFENEKTVFSDGSKTVVFDTEKTSIGELMQMDTSPYITIGRGNENQIKIDSQSVSRQHCKIKLLAPMIVEIIDLGSSNGTFADGLKLEAQKKYQFSSCVQVKLGLNTNLDLKKIFKDKIEIIKKQPTVAANNHILNKPEQKVPKDFNATPQEMEQFYHLEKIWNEYSERMRAASSSVGEYSMKGAIIGGVASFLGPVGALVGIGANLFSRYLGMQKSNEIRNDVNFEEAFLVAYSCPRCSESFQKKPWVTIRDCGKCKTKFK